MKTRTFTHWATSFRLLSIDYQNLTVGQGSLAGFSVPTLVRPLHLANYAAELLGEAETKGVVAPTYWANIIALKSNSLLDITQLEQVKFVMKKGQVVRLD